MDAVTRDAIESVMNTASVISGELEALREHLSLLLGETEDPDESE